MVGGAPALHKRAFSAESIIDNMVSCSVGNPLQGDSKTDAGEALPLPQSTPSRARLIARGEWLPRRVRQTERALRSWSRAVLRLPSSIVGHTGELLSVDRRNVLELRVQHGWFYRASVGAIRKLRQRPDIYWQNMTTDNANSSLMHKPHRGILPPCMR
jgi:hypothetical protein